MDKKWWERIPWKEILVAVLTALLTIVGSTSVQQVAGCRNIIVPPPDPDTPPPDGEPDPWNAIGKIAMQGGYCSGTVVGPRGTDGRWKIVSAAHCFKRVGEEATFIQRAGIARKITVIAIDRRADIAICTTETGQGKMAFAMVAYSTPIPQSPVWHGGYGRHIPGNKESGRVLTGPNNDNQVKYHLSVSPGDSGGGIVTDLHGHLLSPVCCTTRLDGPGEVWGGSPEQINRMLTTPTDYIDLPPMAMPPPPKEKDDAGKER